MSKSTDSQAVPSNAVPQVLPSHAPEGSHPDAYARLLHHSDLQFSFPSFEEPKPPAWLEALGRLLNGADPVLHWVFWIVVAALATLVVYVLVRQAMKLRWRKTERDDAVAPQPIWRPAPEKARLLLADADRLATAGNFAGAVHLLLLRSIQDIDERFPRLVRPAFTSREIGRLSAIPPAARTTFAGIAQVVERALFAGSEIGADEFQRCRTAYEHFAFPDHWSATA